MNAGAVIIYLTKKGSAAHESIFLHKVDIQLAGPNVRVRGAAMRRTCGVSLMTHNRRERFDAGGLSTRDCYLFFGPNAAQN